MNYIDPWGLIGIFGGGSGSIGVGGGTDGGSNYITGGSGGYYGTKREKDSNNGGSYSTFSEYGKIQGGAVGGGFFGGIFIGDVEDIEGETKTITTHAEFISFSQIYDMNGKLWGFGIGFGGKGFGLGVSYSEEYTVDLK